MPSNPDSKEPASARPSPGKAYVKPLMVVVALTLLALAYWQFGDQITFANLARSETQLKQLEAANPWLFLGGAFLLYAVVSGLSLPGGAVVLSLVFGSYFGWLRGLILVSFASTLGATLAFLSSRYLIGSFVQNRFADQLKTFNAKLEDEGAFYLFTLRLVPLVPFFMLNLVMGLTRMKTRTYWWISQIGMLPGTMAYLYAGSTVKISELAEHGFQGLGWEFAAGFALLGTLPLLIKKTLDWTTRSKQA